MHPWPFFAPAGWRAGGERVQFRTDVHVCPCAYLSLALTTHECHCGKRMWYKLGFGVLFQNPSAKVGEEAFGIFP